MVCRAPVHLNRRFSFGARAPEKRRSADSAAHSYGTLASFIEERLDLVSFTGSHPRSIPALA